MSTEEILKFDEGKPDWAVIPFDALEKIVCAFEYGVKKYKRPFAYRAGIPYMRLWASAIRHLVAWRMGEDKASDSGVDHLAHACANILMILSIDCDFDDR